MWTLGDVAEFFVKPGGERSDYWEIHVTPNGYLMDLHIPDRDRFTEREVTWEEVLAPDSGTLRRVWRLEDRWAVEVRIPWKAFGLDSAPGPGTEWSFAVCRYNYNRRPGKPRALLHRQPHHAELPPVGGLYPAGFLSWKPLYLSGRSGWWHCIVDLGSLAGWAQPWHPVSGCC